MKIRSRVSAVGATIMALTASAAFSLTYTPETYDPARSFQGIITDYWRSVMTVESERGEVHRFQVLYDTGIAVDGNVGKRGDLRPGMYVEVIPARNPSVATSVIAHIPAARERY